MTTTFSPITSKLATIYIAGSFMGNINKYEARDVTITRGKYAQYEDAVFITFTPKGKRKPVRLVDSYKPSALVLDGIGHPEPADMFGEATLSSTGCIVRQATHSSCSDGWRVDFNAMIDTYIADKSPAILGDFRSPVEAPIDPPKPTISEMMQERIEQDAKRLAREQKQQEDKSRRERERAEHIRNNPHLTVAHGSYSPKTAAENIRKELKRQFPGFAFSVRTDGNAVDIRWTDGPTQDEVSKYTKRHQYGSFDGMTDSYEYNADATFSDAFGGAKYVMCHRAETLQGYRLAWILQGFSVEELPDDFMETGYRGDLMPHVRFAWCNTDLRPDQFAAALLAKHAEAQTP